MSQTGVVAPLGYEAKINSRHRDRLAVVYVRQSSVHQVERHQESTQLQYGLANHAERLGWARERVAIIDDDLGISGASSEGRLGFQRLLSEVALDHVGIILGVEMSRLARSCKDWYQLLELCALFGTLISDLDGLYDPSCYNDRLLLGLKGTMSEAELHILRQRMWQGALQKARRGDLPSKGPIGYVRAGDQLVLDPDEQAQDVVRLIFDQFERLGTMNAVLRYLVTHEIRIPVRLASGPSKGQLDWRRPHQTLLQNLLSHPAYAGAYVFGRTTESQQARQQKRPHRLPRDEWLVLLRDRHPAYISWDQYEENQLRLAENRSRYSSRCSVRVGSALLAGLVVCGRCGNRFRTQYGGRGTTPRYSCSANQSRLGEEQCQSLAAKPLDDEVARLALKALEPSGLDVSLEVAQDIQQQRAAAEKLWRQRLERATYEAERAARQYQVVEPENRLVARTLEATWEEKLRTQRHLQEQYERYLREQPKGLTEDEQERIRRLATDVPALWQAATTADVDRKEILREVIDRVVVNVEGESEWVEAKVHWSGGHQTFTRFRRPVNRFDQLSTWPELKRRIPELLEARMSASQIATQLNRDGLRTTDGKSFREQTVRMLILRQGLLAAHPKLRHESILLREHEWLVGALAKKLGVSHSMIHQWIHEHRIAARQLSDRRWIVTADEAKCQELVAYRIYQRQRRQHHESTSAQAKLSGNTM